MKIVEIEQCAHCPWLKWTAEPRCGNPDMLDKRITDTMDIPKWCPLYDKEDT